MYDEKVQYTHEIAPATSTQSPIWRSNDCPESGLTPYLYEDAKTLYEGFCRGLRISGDDPCYGYRPQDENGKFGPYVWLSYNEVNERLQNFGSGLLYLDLVPERQGLHCLGIFSRNRVEWGITEQTCNAYNFALVPTYETLGADAILHILRETEMKTIVCSCIETVKVLSLMEKGVSLEVVIQMEEVEEKDRELAKKNGITLYSMSEIEKIGKEHRSPVNPPKPDDICTICYTSGTTSVPKGALISHQNLMASVGGCVHTGLFVRNDSVYLSYLPQAHILERLLHAAFLEEGGRIGFYQGCTANIMDDLKALRPTVFTSVPRLLNKIYQKLNDKMAHSSALVRFLFYRGIAAKTANLARGYNTHWFYDNVVFNKVREQLGLDRLLICISGSAPLSPEVLTFLRCILGNKVVEGYGATETAGASLLQEAYDFTSGHVGGPMSCCDLRLEDVPDMNYCHTDREHNNEPCIGRGEICLRGPSIISGYFRHPELTKENIDEDGFLHTGDIGMVYPNGCVKIIDRKKNFFKLSQGEYIAAEKLELLYSQSSLVNQIFIYGDSRRSFLVSIVVADEDGVKAWAKQNSIDKSFEELCDSAELKAAMKADFDRIVKEQGLKGFERIRDFKIEKEQWTDENGLLTPTFKLKRPFVQKAFQKELDALYEANPEFPDKKICEITLERMQEISAYICDQMDKGLRGEPSDLQMLPSFVDDVCTGEEQGTVMAIDMGGSNVRVVKYALKGNGLIDVEKEVKHAFPVEYMSGTAEQVFGFLADCIKEAGPEPGMKLGFTFSFPSKQTAINHSYLVIWTKGFSASGCVGVDSVELLEKALQERGVDIKVSAICNDTVGTLISRSYWDPNTAIGIILGTGCNAAYIENTNKITKCTTNSKTGKMIINMECGATGDNNPSILPQTQFDIDLDPLTPNVGHQHLEKMMSGMYLGELTRMWATDLWKKKQLFTYHDGTCDFFTKNMSFDSKYCSIILGDSSDNLDEIDRILTQFSIPQSTKEDREQVRRIVYHIVRRSARLMASFIHAIYTHMGDEYKGKTVGVDGSVYKYMPYYQTWVAEALEELGRKDIEIGLADDGSSIGAALIAYSA